MEQLQVSALMESDQCSELNVLTLISSQARIRSAGCLLDDACGVDRAWRRERVSCFWKSVFAVTCCCHGKSGRFPGPGEAAASSMYETMAIPSSCTGHITFPSCLIANCCRTFDQGPLDGGVPSVAATLQRIAIEPGHGYPH